MCLSAAGGKNNGMDANQEEELLENWIKELEQGIQGMSDVTGTGTESTTVSYYMHTDLLVNF